MNEDKLLEILKTLEGLQTIDTAAEALHMKKQSTLNLMVKLKKERYATVSGGGKQKRIYKITTTRQLPRVSGMFDILNKYNPNFKLNPWYDHQVHGIYGPEEALIDAIQTKSFRVILASMRLFNHITSWPKLYKLSKEKDCWQQVGALYDVARLSWKVKSMPPYYSSFTFKKKKYLIRPYPTQEDIFKPIAKKWKVFIPFKKGDLLKVAS